MRRLAQDGTAEPLSRDQIVRAERGQGKNDLPCSADHEQDWQPYPVDPYFAVCEMDHTYTVAQFLFPVTYLYVCSSHIARVTINQVRLPILPMFS